jgi:murein DD-endopeptidase MepM/ murein hydrolase activator NlpD
MAALPANRRYHLTVFLAAVSPRRTVVFLAVLVTALSLLAAADTVAADPLAEQQHALDHKIANAKARENELSNVIAGQSSAISSLRGEIDSLGAEVEALEARLTAARARLAVIQARLLEQTRRVEMLREQLSIARKRLAERLLEIYTSGDDASALEILLGAQSLDEAIEQVELYNRVLEQDDALVQEIHDLRVEMVVARRQTQELEQRHSRETELIAEQTAARSAAFDSLVAQRGRLEAMRSDREAELASLEVQRKEWEQEADALAAESAQVASAATAGSPPPGSGGSGLIWPVSGTVVSPFGMRWGRLHSGIDIAAPTGAPVVAAASGRVTYAGSMSGYGYIVVIQHSGSLATAYAHNSSLAVTNGQNVSQGQRIASVGCTGTCYGPHVHFEVRVNGTPVDPMGYL